ncbi:heme biosynthesis protein HemY [Lutimaribacter sp. EGI FJ00015]|uniref:Heme biosynthesis protein HemY n=1 Tax=Lutimaribacter degradans TaxID=2945989 RepID=A0ACC5ZUN5_9RHOB|nr:heme biosynthesis HemY N-terminal domain-containing protein [Lutimaribacter sp. EGI FJ00013]MCM2562007.1 heme biosynthesis protein HemY [Lutimaribacter sp. EGI FJ00013]MCO0612961.1 heme biosynthesis protein HemY [Lutimaribacter sp. EGI FJ00015]MCO0635839.1 heme biosynthesis protein HemY [Lutimaribacter sp. EGI FJ00014]
MLWSIIKIVVFFTLVAALAWGAWYVLDMDGGVTIQAAGVEVTLTPILSVLGLVVLVVAVWLFLRLFGLLIAVLKFINGDDTAISRYFDRSRERKGFQALSEGMMALASGEGRVAMAKAARAERYLNKPELTNLLIAQAAEMTGDRRRAEEVYKRLLEKDETRFVGVRGIMKQKLADGDRDTARQLATKALELKPRHEETQDALLQLQAQAEDWAGARDTLRTKLRTGTIPKDVHKRRDAVLALSGAKDVLAEGNDIAAREAAIEANRLSPDLVPAAVLAARAYVEQGKKKYAVRVIKKAWAAQPHPDLAGAFAAIEPDETPQARIKRFKQLTKLAPDHRETKLLEAELLIAAEDFPAARRALGDMAENAPDARALTIMAAIERGEGASDAVVKGWLARALSAPRGPQWVCDNCQHIHTDWVPVCENCQSFDTLSWRAPPASQTSTPSGIEMLPLIVGGIEDKTTPTAEDTEKETATEIMDAEVVDTEADDAETSKEDETGRDKVAP